MREVKSEYAGKTVACPRCKHPGIVHDTIQFLKKFIGKYSERSKELQQLRAQLVPAEQEDSTFVDEQLLADVDIHNTTTLADPQQYEPIVVWMKKRQVKLDVNHQAIDTTGFFDEVAVRLGDDYDILKPVSNQIKYIQQKGYTNAKLSLSTNTQEQITAITNFCRELHDYSFVSKYFYNKRERSVHLTLQTAPSVTKFFMGEWMEWFVFMKILNSLRKEGVPVACLRGFHVNFPNRDRYEIDGFFLIGDGIPVCIECKTGEFRQDIARFSLLRKRLNLDKMQ